MAGRKGKEGGFMIMIVIIINENKRKPICSLFGFTLQILLPRFNISGGGGGEKWPKVILNLHSRFLGPGRLKYCKE